MGPVDDTDRPVIWSVAGNDSGGGAGLSADLRAAEGCGVHLCPVVASVTAQNSQGVWRVDTVAPDLLDAQFAALAEDLRPSVIKTGLIGSAAGVRVLLRWLDRFNAGPQPRVRLVVDPVLGASAGGAAFAGDELLCLYRDELLPRTDLVTPNRAEAARLLGLTGPVPTDRVPTLARQLRELGAVSVAITGGDSPDGHEALDWIDTPHACGWLSLPRLDAVHSHGTGCTFATTAAAAMARGFVVADALVLAKMATTAALAGGYAAGQGAGPVGFDAAFAGDPRWLPRLSCDETPVTSTLPKGEEAVAAWPAGLYAIVDGVDQMLPMLAPAEPLLSAVQLRIKRAAHMALDDVAFAQSVRAQIGRALALRAGQPASARPVLVINDHHGLVLDLIEAGDLAATDVALHLGQEDVLALGPSGRRRLAAAQARGLQLGLSSHSLWELCRAAGLAPSYIACGPVWATTTKDMPWRPQGLHNLRWWAAMSPVSVVGIGGILEAAQVTGVAGSGAACVCLVRALASRPGDVSPVAARLAACVAAWRAGCVAGDPSGWAVAPAALRWPQASLDGRVPPGG